MIQLDNVFKFYKTPQHMKVVLDHVSAVFETGWSYGLLGVNGAGKSTTLRLIAGTELPNAGRIRSNVRISWPLEFECYLVDEITGVGDMRFQRRCEEAFAARRAKADLIVVSHSMATIKSYCRRGMVLVDGHIMQFDNVDKAIEVYNRLNR
jgi:ABC-type polysaccharide/polyol phosphate transport system ATPase subunit